MTLEHNPFAPPESEPPSDSGDMEEIRRQYLNRELAVRVAGWLYTLAGAGNILVGLALLTGSFETEPSIDAAAVAFHLGLGIVFLTFGYGLRSLLNWTRVLAVFAGVAIILAAAAFHGVAAILFQIGFLAALFGPRAKHVCSAEYREIVRQTPGMNRTTGAWIVLLVLAAIVIAAVMSLPTALPR